MSIAVKPLKLKLLFSILLFKQFFRSWSVSCQRNNWLRGNWHRREVFNVILALVVLLDSLIDSNLATGLGLLQPRSQAKLWIIRKYDRLKCRLTYKNFWLRTGKLSWDTDRARVDYFLYLLVYAIFHSELGAVQIIFTLISSLFNSFFILSWGLGPRIEFLYNFSFSNKQWEYNQGLFIIWPITFIVNNLAFLFHVQPSF